MRILIKPCLVGLLNVLLTVTLSVAVAVTDEPVGPPEPVRIRMQANPMTANTAPSFAMGGKVTTAFGSGPSEAHSLSVQPDGKILMGGWTYSASGPGLAVSRYLANGRLDITFGNAGQVIGELGGCSGYNQIALRSDSKIIESKYACGQVYVAVYLPDGSPDTSFGTGGYVEHWLGFDFYPTNSVAIQPDGKILIAGYGDPNGSQDIILVRLLDNGSLDATFGLGGYVTTYLGFNNYQAESILLQPDGKTVVTGKGSGGFAVVRYLPNGVLDNTFGNQGLALAFVDSGISSFASTRQSDGKILVAGSSITKNPWGNTREGITVVRFLVDGTPRAIA